MLIVVVAEAATPITVPDGVAFAANSVAVVLFVVLYVGGSLRKTQGKTQHRCNK